MQRSWTAFALVALLPSCAKVLGMETGYRDGTSASGGGSSGGAPGSGGSTSGTGGGSGGNAARRFLSVAAGDKHTCALELGGAVTCWGGFSSDVRDSIPTGVYDTIESGYEESCALKNGYATCFGSDATVNSPPNISLTSIAIGNRFACGLDELGTVECWGSSAPTPPAGSYIAIAAAEAFACALGTDGVIECFGSGAPTPPDGSYASLDLGRAHGCAIEEITGLVRCFGDNLFGQLSAPNGPFTAVSAGGDATCLLDEVGAISCFGSNSSGQLEAPRGSFASVTVGGEFGCALLSGQVIQCWGTPLWDGATYPTN